MEGRGVEGASGNFQCIILSGERRVTRRRSPRQCTALHSKVAHSLKQEN